MDHWLEEHLVCPRDHQKLEQHNEQLTCASGHVYPIVDGIPIMLLDEVVPTQWNTTATLERVAELRASQPSPPEDAPRLWEPQQVPDSPNEVHPHVQNIIVATGGNLYVSLTGKLPRYPIPFLRLPRAKGEMFLEIGCNWGRWCVAAARRGYSPVGIDPALEAVIAAREVCRQLKAPALFVVADGRYLPFAPGSFDVVFSYSVLQHFSKENARLTLSEVARVLKTRGVSFIQMPNIYGVRSLYHQVRRRFREAREFEVRYWTPSELRDTFARLIGPSTLSVDGYFGLNVQKSDADLLPPKYKAVIAASEVLRRMSRRARWMLRFADSLYIRSIKKDRPL